MNLHTYVMVHETFAATSQELVLLRSQGPDITRPPDLAPHVDNDDGLDNDDIVPKDTS